MKVLVVFLVSVFVILYSETYRWIVIGSYGLGALVIFLRGAVKPYSRAWKKSWFLKPLANVMVFVGLAAVWSIVHSMISKNPSGSMHLVAVCLSLMMGAAWCASFFIVAGLDRYAEDPETQKKLSGTEAEATVRKIILKAQKKFHSSLSIHNALFVFNVDLPNEYSREIDHILITQKNIYVFETKYKSGEIIVSRDANAWQVKRYETESTMRNPFQQVKEGIKFLENHFALPGRPVPIIMIIGDDVTISGEPANVFTEATVMDALKLCEEAGAVRIADPAATVAMLSTHLKTEKFYMVRHVQRAERKELERKAKLITDIGSV